MRDNTLNTLAYEACPQCDLLLKSEVVAVGIKAHCPRCGCQLYRPRHYSVERTFALSLTGLILFIPVNLLPLVGILVLGNAQEASLWSGVSTLYVEGLWGVAILVFLASMAFPFLKISLSLLISGHLYFHRPHRYLNVWMRTLQHLDEWAMLEVYTLGIIVACVKLASRTELKFGLGLAAFIALLLVIVMLTSSLDEYLFWRRIEALNKSNSKHNHLNR
ncbi:MAG: paraquat-inducible protein A [Methylococcales bacterium]